MNRTHGLYGTKVYKAWWNIKERCRNPNHKSYPSYGASGIDICDDWVGNFKKFFEHVGHAPSSNHSIDRIDNDRGYEPGNVRWATNVEQSRNTSRSLRITHLGKTQCLQDWANEIGVDAAVMHKRIHKGWPVEKVLSAVRFSRWGTPLRRKHHIKRAAS